LILSLLVVLALSVTPAMGDGGTMNTAFAVQNLGDSTTTVTVEFRNTAGTLTSTLSEDIAAGENYNFDQRYASGDPGEDPFQGSATVSAGEPIGAVANIMRTGGTPGYESYNSLGSAEIGEDITLPQILKNVTSAGVTWNTTIVIQNTLTDSAVNVDVIFTPYPDGGLGTAFTKEISIPAGGTYYMDQADEPTAGQIGATFYGSAKVEAESAVGVTVYSDGGGQILMAYPSYKAGTTVPIGLPSIYKNIVSLGDSYSTAVLVVNLGDAAAEVEIEYLPASGSYTVSGTDTFTIPANGVKNIDQRYDAPSITSATFLGGAIVQSTNDVPIAAMVNLRGGSRYGMTYGGLMNSGMEAYLPIAYKDISSAGYSWSSTIIVYNFGAPSDASVNFTFYPSVGSPIVDPTTYTVSDVEQFDLRYTTAIASEASFIGAVKVESTDQAIGVLVQTRGAGGAGDALMAFQGLMP
jgi:hypothetical protein